jgi:hypothetical protein
MEKGIKKRKRAPGTKSAQAEMASLAQHPQDPKPVCPLSLSPPLTPRLRTPDLSLTPLTLRPHLSVVPYLEQETDPNTASRMSVRFTLNPNPLAKPERQ